MNSQKKKRMSFYDFFGKSSDTAPDTVSKPNSSTVKNVSSKSNRHSVPNFGTNMQNKSLKTEKHTVLTKDNHRLSYMLPEQVLDFSKIPTPNHNASKLIPNTDRTSDVKALQGSKLSSKSTFGKKSPLKISGPVSPTVKNGLPINNNSSSSLSRPPYKSMIVDRKESSSEGPVSRQPDPISTVKVSLQKNESNSSLPDFSRQSSSIYPESVRKSSLSKHSSLNKSTSTRRRKPPPIFIPNQINQTEPVNVISGIKEEVTSPILPLTAGSAATNISNWETDSASSPLVLGRNKEISKSEKNEMWGESVAYEPPSFLSVETEEKKIHNPNSGDVSANKNNTNHKHSRTLSSIEEITTALENFQQSFTMDEISENHHENGTDTEEFDTSFNPTLSSDRPLSLNLSKDLDNFKLDISEIHDKEATTKYGTDIASLHKPEDNTEVTDSGAKIAGDNISINLDDESKEKEKSQTEEFVLKVGDLIPKIPGESAEEYAQRLRLIQPPTLKNESHPLLPSTSETSSCSDVFFDVEEPNLRENLSNLQKAQEATEKTAPTHNRFSFEHNVNEQLSKDQHTTTEDITPSLVGSNYSEDPDKMEISEIPHQNYSPLKSNDFTNTRTNSSDMTSEIDINGELWRAYSTATSFYNNADLLDANAETHSAMSANDGGHVMLTPTDIHRESLTANPSRDFDLGDEMDNNITGIVGLDEEVKSMEDFYPEHDLSESGNGSDEDHSKDDSEDNDSYESSMTEKRKIPSNIDDRVPAFDGYIHHIEDPHNRYSQSQEGESEDTENDVDDGDFLEFTPRSVESEGFFKRSFLDEKQISASPQSPAIGASTRLDMASREHLVVTNQDEDVTSSSMASSLKKSHAYHFPDLTDNEALPINENHGISDVGSYIPGEDSHLALNSQVPPIPMLNVEDSSYENAAKDVNIQTLDNADGNNVQEFEFYNAPTYDRREEPTVIPIKHSAVVLPAPPSELVSNASRNRRRAPSYTSADRKARPVSQSTSSPELFLNGVQNSGFLQGDSKNFKAQETIDNSLTNSVTGNYSEFSLANSQECRKGEKCTYIENVRQKGKKTIVVGKPSIQCLPISIRQNGTISHKKIPSQQLFRKSKAHKHIIAKPKTRMLANEIDNAELPDAALFHSAQKTKVPIHPDAHVIAASEQFNRMAKMNSGDLGRTASVMTVSPQYGNGMRLFITNPDSDDD